MISGGLWGSYRAAAYKRRLTLCDDFLSVLMRTNILIRYNCCDVSEIMRELKQLSVIFGNVPDVSEAEDIRKSMCEAAEISGAADEEKKLILQFCSELGTSDTEGQLSMLDSLKVLTDELRGRRSEEYAKYGRLYRTAGLLFGLMAGITMI